MSSTNKLGVPVLGLLAIFSASTQAGEDAIAREAAALARALERLDQGYRYSGLRAGHGVAATEGGSFNDHNVPSPAPVAPSSGQSGGAILRPPTDTEPE